MEEFEDVFAEGAFYTTLNNSADMWLAMSSGRFNNPSRCMFKEPLFGEVLNPPDIRCNNSGQIISPHDTRFALQPVTAEDNSLSSYYFFTRGDLGIEDWMWRNVYSLLYGVVTVEMTIPFLMTTEGGAYKRVDYKVIQNA